MLEPNAEFHTELLDDSPPRTSSFKGFSRVSSRHSPGAQPRSSDRPSDCWQSDFFFTSVYQYFLNKGFFCSILTQVSHLLTLGFTIGFSTFLMACVDWGSLFKCETEEACRAVIGLRDEVFENPSFGDVLVLMYCAVFSLYWVWILLRFACSLHGLGRIRDFYKAELAIDDDELSSLEWSTVVARLVLAHSRQNPSTPLTELDITNRILRKETYLIGLLAANILTFRVGDRACSTTTSSADKTCLGFSKTGWDVFATSTEWNLHLCFFHSMFSGDSSHLSPQLIPSPHHYQTLDEDETESPPPHHNPAHSLSSPSPVMVENLQKRFRCVALLNAVFMPFILVFATIFFFLRNAEELHSKKTPLGPRQWTLLARYRLWEFGELPHFFANRLAACEPAALAYIQQFPFAAVVVVARCVGYISGALVALLLVLSVSDSVLVLSFRIWNRNLVWYLAFFSILLALARSFIPGEEASAAHALKPQQLMDQVVRHTHFYPASWRDQAHKKRVFREFVSMFKPRVLVFLEELLSVILAPYIFGVLLPQQALAMLKFVQETTVTVPGVGDLCALATFDPTHFQTLAVRSTRSGVALRDAARQSQQVVSLTASSSASLPAQTKLEKSLIAFTMRHPKWVPSSTQRRYLNRLVSLVQHSRPSFHMRDKLGHVFFRDPVSSARHQMSADRTDDPTLSSASPADGENFHRKRDSESRDSKSKLSRAGTSGKNSRRQKRQTKDFSQHHDYLSQSNRELAASFADLLARPGSDCELHQPCQNGEHQAALANDGRAPAHNVTNGSVNRSTTTDLRSVAVAIPTKSVHERPIEAERPVQLQTAVQMDTGFEGEHDREVDDGTDLDELEVAEEYLEREIDNDDQVELPGLAPSTYYSTALGCAPLLDEQQREQAEPWRERPVTCPLEPKEYDPPFAQKREPKDIPTLRSPQAPVSSLSSLSQAALSSLSGHLTSGSSPPFASPPFANTSATARPTDSISYDD